MRSLDAELAGADDLSPIRDALSSGIEELEAAVKWLLENSPGDQNAPGAASVNLLMCAGTVAGGWQMVRAALAAKKRLADGDPDSAFLEPKVMTALCHTHTAALILVPSGCHIGQQGHHV